MTFQYDTHDSAGTMDVVGEPAYPSCAFRASLPKSRMRIAGAIAGRTAALLLGIPPSGFLRFTYSYMGIY
jgi:hypothetical protein